MSESKKEKKPGCYLYTAIGAMIVVLVFEWLWPDVIPFTFTQFLHLNAPISEVLRFSIPVFLWGGVLSLILVVVTRNEPEMNQVAELLVPVGFVASVVAGVFEELAFRWLIFYNQIIGYWLTNQIFFAVWGWIGIPEWWHLHVTAPVVNFVLGLPFLQVFHLAELQPFISGEFLGWAVGAAIVTSVGKFRDAHVYHGLFGKVNVWFIGMFMFVLMFKYGLFAAMIVHFTYDLIVFMVIAIDAIVEKRRGFV